MIYCFKMYQIDILTQDRHTDQLKRCYASGEGSEVGPHQGLREQEPGNINRGFSSKLSLKFLLEQM